MYNLYKQSVISSNLVKPDSLFCSCFDQFTQACKILFIYYDIISIQHKILDFLCNLILIYAIVVHLQKIDILEYNEIQENTTSIIPKRLAYKSYIGYH